MMKTIVILFGGKSTEYSISLQSAYSVLTNINHTKYKVLSLGITREGDWYLYTGKYENLLDDTWWKNKEDIQNVIVSQNKSDHALITESKKIPVDYALPILHGINGEDGTVQGVFQIADIPVIGCDVLASSLCMDKERAHQIVSCLGIPCARSIVIHHINELDKTNVLKYPIFVKPVHAGSSIGIHKIDKKEDLKKAVEDAFTIDKEVIIEEEVVGFEVGCSIIGIDTYTIGKIDEIELSQGFFDFEEKYTLKTSTIHMPARISEIDEKRIQETGLKIYKALGCTGFARVDMFFTADKTIYFNEVNTIPGFTTHSRFPSMMKGIGLSFADMLEKIIGLYTDETK